MYETLVDPTDIFFAISLSQNIAGNKALELYKKWNFICI